MEWYWILIIILAILIILALIKIFLINGKMTPLNKNLEGKIVIITGSSSGLGLDTAIVLLEKGATVIFACRDKNKTMGIISTFSVEHQNRSKFIQLNLSDFDSLPKFLAQFNIEFPDKKIDFLINNAGMMEETFHLTSAKIESTIHTNHLSPIILTGLLLNNMNQEDGRIINIASAEHERIKSIDFDELENDMNFAKLEPKYSSRIAYSLSKLGNIVFTKNLALYLERKENFLKVKTISLHPGYVNTNFLQCLKKNMCLYILYYIFLPFIWYFFRPTSYGIQTILHLCYTDNGSLVNGGYYDDLEIKQTSDLAKNIDINNRLMKYSISLFKDKIDCESCQALNTYISYIKNL